LRAIPRAPDAGVRTYANDPVEHALEITWSGEAARNDNMAVIERNTRVTVSIRNRSPTRRP
jgi:hypothetical protein